MKNPANKNYKKNKRKFNNDFPTLGGNLQQRKEPSVNQWTKPNKHTKAQKARKQAKKKPGPQPPQAFEDLFPTLGGADFAKMKKGKKVTMTATNGEKMVLKEVKKKRDEEEEDGFGGGKRRRGWQ